MVYAKQLKVGKIERYTFGIGGWLNGDTLVNASVVACGTSLRVNSSDFSGSTIGFFAEGLARGAGSVIVSYETATRTDSIKLVIVVLDADVC